MASSSSSEAGGGGGGAAIVEPSVDTSNHVYIQSDDYGWIPAQLLSTADDNSTAVVSIPQYRTEQQIQSDGGRAAKRREKQTISLKDYPNHALLLQNVDEKGNLREVKDMVDLPFLHEAAILYNLKSRHVKEKPYTRTGDIVIACNPYKWYYDLYSEARREMYASALVWNVESTTDPRTKLEPHVYETSSLAYRGLALEGEAQSILVSGESGAGKTETVKILLSDLASIQRGQTSTTTTKQSSPGRKKIAPTAVAPETSGVSPIVQRVLDSNPLLEAFGNAKTIRNDNSSRFGKYLQLQFDTETHIVGTPSCVLAGSTCKVYLLEKSRVVSHEDEERTYHIFYQLLAAPDEVKLQFWEGLEDTDCESFSYVGYTETHTIEGMPDAERFQQTLKSLELIGIAGDKLKALMQTLCVVLLLGNLLFGEDETDESRSVIDSPEEFNELAQLMGCPSQDLLAALTIRTVTARNEVFQVPMTSGQAKDSCDAFAKEIYAKTFLWLVRSINDATCAERNYDGSRRSDFGLIGMLDIFGFESFETNRYEQLCINYANEKLQQKFTQDIFRSVQAEYEYEGIELEEITYDDNTDVLDLVEGRMGLLDFLNEECVRPGGSDKGFVLKARAMNKDNPCFFTDNFFTDVEFGVNHYAGAVIYNADNFVTKNMDTLPSDLQECARKSSNVILANELDNDAMMNETTTASSATGAAAAKKRPNHRPKKKPPTMRSGKQQQTPIKKKSSNLVGTTVWTKFKNQLTDLMESINKTRTRYIRCIKPNSLKQPLILEHVSTIEQLRCAGVVAAVTISRSAFPNRLEHEVILDRFQALWRHASERVDAYDRIAEEYAEEDPGLIPGLITNCLLEPALSELEVVKHAATDTEPAVIQKAFVIGRTRTYFRAGALEYLEAKRVRRLNEWAKLIQSTLRRFILQRDFLLLRRGTIKLQALTRQKTQLRIYKKQRAASIVLECSYRCVLARRLLVKLRRNYKARLIQNRWRKAVAMAYLKQHVAAAVVMQTLVRGALQRPKFRVALHERREEAKLENQVLALQRKLEEAEARRVQAERQAEERAQKAAQERERQAQEAIAKAQAEARARQAAEQKAREFAEQMERAVSEERKKILEQERERIIAEEREKILAEERARIAAEQEEKKEATPAVIVQAAASPAVTTTPDGLPMVVNGGGGGGSSSVAGSVGAALMAGQLSDEQQHLMDESGKMLEYLRKEVFKLRSQNAQLRTDFDLLKDNNQRLMDANASAGASFAALNQHAKQLTKQNDKLSQEVSKYKTQVQKLNVAQVELKEELVMKSTTYAAEVQSRLSWQKSLGRIVDVVTDKCRDTRLVEEVLGIADACEAAADETEEGMLSPFPERKMPPKQEAATGGVMGSLRSLWS